MTRRPEVGDTAPDFTAPGTGGRQYSVSEYRGHPLVLVFYPGDASPTCTEQLSSYSAGMGDFSDVKANLLGLSPQDVESHERFSQKHNFQFPLLYDQNKHIGSMYGILGPLGYYRRSIFVIDSLGIIRKAKRYTAGLTYAKTPEIIKWIQEAESNH